MKSFRKELKSFSIKNYNKFERWRWVVIAVIGLGLLSVEVYEFFKGSFLNPALHKAEVFLYAALLICIGLFPEFLIQLNRAYDLRKKLKSFLIKNYNKFERWRWVVIAVIGLGLFSAEVYEFIELSFLNQPLHIGEVFLYAALLICTGLFLELFVRLNRVHNRTIKILKYKHELSLELTAINNWDMLIARLAELPGKIVEAEETYLFTSNLISRKFEIVSHWSDCQKVQPAEQWNPTIPCPKCLEKDPEKNSQIHLCRNENDTAPSLAYSLVISDEELPSTLLKFRLSPGLQLSSDDEKILLNISDEIAMALRIGREQKSLSELQSAQVAMAERRLISAYVHDQLGQNLGYLHLKLDQLGENENIISLKDAHKDLSSLRKVANDSYEIVRNILKKIQPETIPHLTNLLKEHAIKVSHAANFTLEFRSTGPPAQLSADFQNTVFYAFHEILSNVEKHSKANLVKVRVLWSDAFLDISVTDNGVGFNPKSVKQDEHFGLEILQERIRRLNGELSMNSSLDSGTIVSISLPF